VPANLLAASTAFFDRIGEFQRDSDVYGVWRLPQKPRLFRVFRADPQIAHNLSQSVLAQIVNKL
jgi:hypothetical protein